MITKTEFEVWWTRDGKNYFPYSGPYDSREEAEKIAEEDNKIRYFQLSVVSISRSIISEKTDLVFKSERFWNAL